MTEIKFKPLLEALLKNDNRLIDEHKELNLAMIRELADKTDEKLIELLLSNDEVKKKFFLKVKDVYVFKQNDFKFFLDANQIDNSYTAYENKIGLNAGGKYLKDGIDDVVLNFPYKDCVLEGGQSTEEGTDEYFEYNDEKEKYEVKATQRKEIFFNEVLAQDEIDRLYEPKAFTNIKKYTAEGEENLKSFTRDENGIITDNLIIKGNNLLVLHSLKEEFAGKVKLIYIDPPYNTSGENNTFAYNNSFNHTTWLTFLKNRIEIANDLLRDDGILAIAIDDEEQAYLKVLCDEVFHRENHIGTIVVQTKPSGRTTDTYFATSHEYILFYAKKAGMPEINFFELTEEQKKLYKEGNGENSFKWRDFLRTGGFSTPEERPNSHYPIYFNPKTNHISLKLEGSNYVKILPIDSNGKKRVWRKTPDSFSEHVQKGEIKISQNNKGDWKVQIIDRIKKGVRPKSVWIGSKYDASSHGTKLLKEIFDGEKVFSYPKSIYAVKDTIYIFTASGGNDIVLDFFAGSGTTAHATLELNKDDYGNRKFILVEQMDYVEDVTVKRVHQVIKNNKSGSFVYFELAKWNEEAKEKIKECKSLKELEKLLNELSEKYFLNYSVKFKEFQEKIIKEKAFVALPLKKQQEMFAKMLDLNQLYVNASEMEDKKYGLSKEEIALTKNFYGK